MIPFSHSRDRPVDFEPHAPAVRPDGRLLIDLGGTVVEIGSAGGSWLAEARDRYRSFVCDDAVVEIKVVHTGDGIAKTGWDGCLSIVSPDGRSAEIAELGGIDILDGVLRTLLPPVIAPDLMVHGALLTDGCRGFLCSGVSGSGKSTIAGLFPEAAACDELARLHIGSQGVEARSLPFWKARPASVSLSAIFFLEHGIENHRTRLNPSDAVREMKRHVYWPLEDSELTNSSFDTLADVCRETPVFRLAFRPETSIWATMAEGL